MNRDDQLDTALRDHLRAVADASPPPLPFPGGQLRVVAPDPTPWWRRPLMPAAAAIAVAVAAGALWLTLGDDGGGHVVAGPDDSAVEGSTRVSYERFAVRFTWDLDCEVTDHGLGEQPVDIAVETWWSAEDELLRQRWRYGDGSFRDRVVVGDPWNPRESHDIGRTGGPLFFGCVDGSAQVPEPGGGGLFMLNPVQTRPAAEVVDERIAYGAEVVPGQWEDRLGNPTERHVAFGQGTVDGPGGTRIGSTETVEWFIDPDTGQVRERRLSVTFDGLGTVSWSAVLLAADKDERPRDVFQPDWLGEPIDTDPDAPTVTTVLDATTTTFGQDPPATTTLMGGEPDVGG